MYDREVGLYYRDAKYPYPFHKTINGKKDFLEKADFFLKLESLDNTIAIALQTLRSIGENYDDELLYDDDICASDYCEQAGD